MKKNIINYHDLIFHNGVLFYIIFQLFFKLFQIFVPCSGLAFDFYRKNITFMKVFEISKKPSSSFFGRTKILNFVWCVYFLRFYILLIISKLEVLSNKYLIRR